MTGSSIRPFFLALSAAMLLAAPTAAQQEPEASLELRLPLPDPESLEAEEAGAETIEEPAVYLGPLPPPDQEALPADGPPRSLRLRPLAVPGSLKINPPDPTTSGDVSVPGGSAGTGAVEVDVLSSPLSGALAGDAPAVAPPPSLWSGLTPDEIIALLADIPAPIASPRLRQALLAAIADGDMPTASGALATRLMRARLASLDRHGGLDQALRLLDRTPALDHARDVPELAGDLYLYAGRYEAACRVIRSALQRTGDARWVLPGSFCDMIEQQIDRADFQLRLAREDGTLGPAYDALFRALRERLTSSGSADTEAGAPEPVIIDQPLPPRPLALALLRLSGAQLEVPPSPESLLGEAPLLLRALATSPQVPAGARPHYALQAVEANLVPAALLSAALPAAAFANQDFAPLDDDVRREAELYRSIQQAPAVDRLRPVLALRDQMALAGHLPQAVALLTGSLDADRLTQESPRLIGEAIRLFHLDGSSRSRRGAASLRDTLMRRANAGDIDARRVLDGLWPVLTLAGIDTGVAADEGLKRWWEATSRTAAGEGLAERTILLLGTLDALRLLPADLTGLGFPVLERWHGDAVVSRIGADQALSAAAVRGHAAAVLLRSAALIGDDISLAETGRVLAAFKAMTDTGLGELARDIALETLIASGV